MGSQEEKAAASATAFNCTPDKCIYCHRNDYGKGFGPRTLIRCSGCGIHLLHVECMQQAGREVDESVLEPDAVCTCSEACAKVPERTVEAPQGNEMQVYSAWQAKTGASWTLPGEQEYTLEVVQYKEGDKRSEGIVQTAVKIFRSSFKMLLMDNGRDLIEMVCQGYESPALSGKTDEGSSQKDGKSPGSKSGGAGKGSGDDSEAEEDDEEYYSFEDFRVIILRKGRTIVTVATIRVFGPYFAEMPFISTRQGFRREGNCRRMVRAVDSLLAELGVEYLVLPSVKLVLPMWRDKFGFTQLTPQEHEVLRECEIVDMDPETTLLIKRRVGQHDSLDTGGGKGAATAGGCSVAAGPAGAGAGGTKSRPNSQRVFLPPPGTQTAAPASQPPAAEKGRGRGRKAGGAKQHKGGMLITSKKRGGAKRTDATRSNSGRKGGRAASSASRTSRGSQSASDTSSSSSDESSSSSESESESESDAESEKKSESESASSESENESEKPDAEDLEVVRVGARPTGGRGRGRGRGGGRSGGRGAGPRAAPPGPPGPPKAPRKVWPAPPQIHRYPPGQVPPEVMEAYRKFMANREAERAADKAAAEAAAAGLAPATEVAAGPSGAGPSASPSAVTATTSPAAPTSAAGTTGPVAPQGGPAAPNPAPPRPPTPAGAKPAGATNAAAAAAPRKRAAPVAKAKGAAGTAGAAGAKGAAAVPAGGGVRKVARGPVWTVEEKQRVLDTAKADSERKAARRDAVLAITVAESITRALAQIDDLKDELASVRTQLAAERQRSHAYLQLLRQHGIEPPPLTHTPPHTLSTALTWHPANPHTTDSPPQAYGSPVAGLYGGIALRSPLHTQRSPTAARASDMGLLTGSGSAYEFPCPEPEYSGGASDTFADMLCDEELSPLGGPGYGIVKQQAKGQAGKGGAGRSPLQSPIFLPRRGGYSPAAGKTAVAAAVAAAAVSGNGSDSKGGAMDGSGGRGGAVATQGSPGAAGAAITPGTGRTPAPITPPAPTKGVQVPTASPQLPGWASQAASPSLHGTAAAVSTPQSPAVSSPAAPPQQAAAPATAVSSDGAVVPPAAAQGQAAAVGRSGAAAPSPVRPCGPVLLPKRPIVSRPHASVFDLVLNEQPAGTTAPVVAKTVMAAGQGSPARPVQREKMQQVTPHSNTSSSSSTHSGMSYGSEKSATRQTAHAASSPAADTAAVAVAAVPAAARVAATVPFHVPATTAADPALAVAAPAAAAAAGPCTTQLQSGSSLPAAPAANATHTSDVALAAVVPPQLQAAASAQAAGATAGLPFDVQAMQGWQQTLGIGGRPGLVAAGCRVSQTAVSVTVPSAQPTAAVATPTVAHDTTAGGNTLSCEQHTAPAAGTPAVVTPSKGPACSSMAGLGTGAAQFTRPTTPTSFPPAASAAAAAVATATGGTPARPRSPASFPPSGAGAFAAAMVNSAGAAGAAGAAGDGSTSSSPFASPGTIRQFDQECLGVLLPCVLRSWLDSTSSPDESENSRPAARQPGSGPAAAAAAAAIAAPVVSQETPPASVAGAAQPSQQHTAHADTAPRVSGPLAAAGNGAKRPPLSGGAADAAAAAAAHTAHKRRRVSLPLVESVFGSALLRMDCEGGSSTGSSSSDDQAMAQDNTGTGYETSSATARPAGPVAGTSAACASAQARAHNAGPALSPTRVATSVPRSTFSLTPVSPPGMSSNPAPALVAPTHPALGSLTGLRLIPVSPPKGASTAGPVIAVPPAQDVCAALALARATEEADRAYALTCGGGQRVMEGVEASAVAAVAATPTGQHGVVMGAAVSGSQHVATGEVSAVRLDTLLGSSVVSRGDLGLASEARPGTAAGTDTQASHAGRGQGGVHTQQRVVTPPRSGGVERSAHSPESEERAALMTAAKFWPAV